MTNDKSRMGRNPLGKSKTVKEKPEKCDAPLFENVVEETTPLQKLKELKLEVDWAELKRSVQFAVIKKFFVVAFIGSFWILGGCASSSRPKVTSTEPEKVTRKQILELQKNLGRQALVIEDLNKRINLLTTRLEPPKTQGAATVNPGASSVPKELTGEEILFQKAMAALKDSNLPVMEKQVDLLFKGYRTSPLTDSAAYLLGDAYLKKNQPAKAMGLFEKIYSISPDGPRAVATLYNLGVSYQKLNRTQEAKQAFQSILTMYPGSEQASHSAKILASMKESSGAKL